MLATQSRIRSPLKAQPKLGEAKRRPQSPQPNPLWHQFATRVQPKLSVGAPDDPYEREADQVADRVMRMPQPKVQRSCAACAAGGAACPKCAKEETERPAVVRRKLEDSGSTATSVPDEFLSGMGPGQPLDRAARTFMEPRFGHDFGNVRIHTDEKAAQSAQALSAKAYTAGQSLIFAPDEYNTATEAGRWLLAHELVHTVQQQSHRSAGQVRPYRDVKKSERSIENWGAIEHAADTAAAVALQPAITPVHVTPSGPIGVLRRSSGPPPPAKAPAGPQAAAAPKNSADAEAKTLAFYPKDADLEKAFARFKGIPEISAITDPAKRRAFLARMSLYLGPHPGAENHFAKIKRAKFGKDQWAFEPVVDRLNAVHDELKAKRHVMPQSGANFGLRGRWSGPVQSRGLMVHALGLALDYRAATNVQISEPRLVDLQSIFVNEAMRINVGKWQDRRALVIRIGQGKATPKDITDFDAKFREQFEAAALGSTAMKGILPGKDLEDLSKLSKQYRDLKAREKLQGKRGPLAEEREKIQKSTSMLMDPLRQKVQHEMSEYLKQHPELEDLPDVADLEFEHRSSGALFKEAAAALKKAKAKLEVSKKKLALATAADAKASDAALAAAERGKPTERLDKLKADATQRLDEARLALSEAERTVVEATASLETARADRDKWEGKYKFVGEERWFERLRGLRDSLADDLDFMLIGERTVSNPSVAQLLEQGYFNPDEPGKGGFDETFMLTMAHHGFDQGTEWEPGGVDSMHFELAEEVNKLSQPEDAKQKKK